MTRVPDREPFAPDASPRRGNSVRRALLLTAWLLLTCALGLAYPLWVRGQDLPGMTWERPEWLWSLLLLPLVLWRGTWGEDRRIPRLRMGTLRGLAQRPTTLRVPLRDVPAVLRTGALGLMILALARPVDSVNPQIASDEGIDIVIVLDLSGSMQAVMENLPDELQRFVPSRDPRLLLTRLDAAKAVIRDFISRRETDRIGVVVFGKEAYVLSPPTLDYPLLDHLISQMRLQLIDDSATAIGDAVGVAVARLRNTKASSKAILLLTDGDNNAGQVSPDYAAHLANVVGAKVFSIQIGDGESAMVQEGLDLFGQPRLVRQPLPANPELLRQLAQKTGGEMYVATDARALSASFHDVLDTLERTRFESNIASFEGLFDLFMLPGVLLLALEALLRSLVLRRFP